MEIIAVTEPASNPIEVIATVLAMDVFGLIPKALHFAMVAIL